MKPLEKLKGINSNDLIVYRNMLFAFIIKGGALFISLLSTPAFISYFNNNAVLGVWYTLLSIFMWFLNFDFGIGNGIRNNLVQDFANNDFDSAKKTISSGFFSNLIVTLILFSIGIIAITNIDLRWLYKIEGDVISYSALLKSTIFVFASIMLRFLLTTVSSIFYAIQKSAINNFLSLCVSILQFLFVLVADFRTPEESLVNLSIAYLIISNLPVIIAAIVIFNSKLKKCKPSINAIKKEYTKAVFGIGVVFFLCQILYMCIVNTNEFLITNMFGPQYTTEYTFYYKITSLISMAVTLAMTPVWSIITKAMSEKDYVWLNKLYKKMKLFGLCAVALQFILIPFQQIVMDLWLGEYSIKINYSISIAFACFGGAFVYSSILSTIVCGMARMKLQLICYGVGIVLKFAMILFFAKRIGDWYIVVWSNVLILVPYCIVQQVDLDKFFMLKRKSKKIRL